MGQGQNIVNSQAPELKHHPSLPPYPLHFLPAFLGWHSRFFLLPRRTWGGHFSFPPHILSGRLACAISLSSFYHFLLGT